MDRGFLTLTGLCSALTFGGVLLLTAPSTGQRPGQASGARPPQRGSGDVYYPGCNAVRAAGAAPLYRGQPGYRPEMDGDDDGIACEPHRDDVGYPADIGSRVPRRIRR